MEAVLEPAVVGLEDQEVTALRAAVQHHDQLRVRERRRAEVRERRERHAVAVGDRFGGELVLQVGRVLAVADPAVGAAERRRDGLEAVGDDGDDGLEERQRRRRRRRRRRRFGRVRGGRWGRAGFACE